ncbi:MAG: TonB-dependent receptor [Emcibacter sp.]|nr:TonB-dependent receptor [Emcibacter sp.]
MKINTTISSIFALSTAFSSISYTTSAEEAFVIEDIVVTAQKRSERLMDVPISMSAMGAEQINQTGIRELKEIADYIPNLQISQGNDFRSTAIIRGVGSQSRNIGFDARVGVYVDGVYMGQSPALNQELLDLERVEVLRGPQGTLFGKNTVAGAISLVTKKPGDELSGQVSANLGNLNYREFKGIVNIPISDTVATKFSVSKTDRDGYVENIITNNKLIEIDTLAYRAQLRVQASDQLEINMSFDGLNSDSLILVGEPLTDMLGNFPVSIAPEPRKTAFSFDPSDKRDVYGGNIDINYEMDNGYTLKSITGYRKTTAFYTNATDYSPVDIISIEYTDKYKQFSEELQFISPDDQDFTYMVGLYYYHQKAHTQRNVVLGDHLVDAFVEPLYMLGAFTPPLPAYPALPSALVSQLLGFGLPGERVFNNGDVTTKSYAAYFNGSYKITDDLKLGIGARYSIEDKDGLWLLDGRKSGIFFIGSTGPNPADPTADIFTRQDKFFAPAASLTYSISEDANVYAKYSSGYKSGGFNLDYINAAELAANPTLSFNKETVDSFEVGFKGSFMDNRLTLNMAGFYSLYHDYQVQQFVDLGGGRTSIRINNAAKVKTKGIEAEVTFHATEKLTFQGSLGILDAYYDKFLGGGTGGADASGKKLNAPDINMSFSAQYYHDIEALGATLLLRGDVTHQGGYYTTADNVKVFNTTYGGPVPYGYIESLTMLNARIGLISNNESWEIYLWGRNLNNDKQAVDDLRDFFNTASNLPNVGRTYGVEAVFNF